MPGYTATQNADSTWNVLDVPVFGPLPAGARKNKSEIGRAWMLKAVEKSKQRQGENYLGPLHVRHTGDGLPKIPAGKFRLTRVGKYLYEDEKVDAIFADYVGMPSGEYERLKRGELHFRSVEVFDWDKPEINEIALLESDTPFFRFGWDGIEREFPNPGTASTWAPVKSENDASPVAAFAAVGAGGVALFAFNDDEKDSKDEDGDDKPGKKKPGEKDDAEDCPGIDGKHCAKCSETSDEDDDTKEKHMPPVDKKDVTGSDEMKAMTDTVSKLRADHDSLAAKLAAAETEKSQLTAKLSALEAKDATRETETFVAGEVTRSKAALSNYNFSARMESRVKALAAGNADRAKAKADVDDFVAMCKESMQPDPPSTFAAAVGRAAESGDPAEVSAYATKGASHLAAARECVAEFREHVEGKGFETTLPQYLAINVPKKLKALETAR